MNEKNTINMENVLSINLKNTITISDRMEKYIQTMTDSMPYLSREDYEKDILGSFPLLIKQPYLDAFALQVKQMGLSEIWKDIKSKYFHYVKKQPKDSASKISVAAYILCKCKTFNSVAKKIFEENYDAVIPYLKHAFLQRQHFIYDIDLEEQKWYRIIFCVLMAADKDPLLDKKLKDIYCNKWNQIDEYIYKCQLLENGEEKVKALHFMILNTFSSSLTNSTLNIRILELLFVMTEISKNYGYSSLNEDTDTALHMYFCLYYKNFKLLENDFSYKLKQYIKTKITAEKLENNIMTQQKYKDLNSVLKDVLFFFSSEDCNIYAQSYEWFDNLTKNESDKVIYLFFNQFFYKEIIADSKQEEIDKKRKDFFDAVCNDIGQVITDHFELSLKRNRIGMTICHSIIRFIYQYKLNVSRIDKDLSIEKIFFSEKKNKQSAGNSNDYSSLLKEIDALKKQMREYQCKENYEKSLRMEIRDLKKKNNDLKIRLNEYKTQEKELFNLREYIYQTESEVEAEVQFIQADKKDIEEMALTLNDNVRGVIAGGHINFHNKLSKYLPDWKFYLAEKIVSKDVLSKSDLLVFFTNHIDHPSYLATMGNLKCTDCNLTYLHNVNIEYVIQKLYIENIAN